jgi:cytochrome d ubiquinol oxidase subunit II
MPDAGTILSWAMMIAAIVYALTGGADYGAGVWDLLARGPRAAAQRALIENAIGPIWEANHVWLIFIVVVMFSAFPPAYAAISTALHVPLTLLLFGIVARGAAFTFRAYDKREDHVQRRWGLVFSIASIAAPTLLGVLVGSVSTGQIVIEQGIVTSGFLTPWATSLFAWSVGLLALALFSYLAAVYLFLAASEDRALADDFRARALAALAISTVMAGVALVLARTGAPTIFERLVSGPYSLILFGAAALASFGALRSLLLRQPHLARVFAAAQVALIVLGWGANQAPWLVMNEISFASASAPPHVQEAILGVVVIGGVPLTVALVVMYRVFHRVESKPH